MSASDAPMLREDHSLRAAHEVRARMNRILFLSALCCLTACETLRATGMPTPRARVTECESLCSELGLQMSAVVIIMSNAGCVCEKPRSASSQSGPAGVSAGAVIAATAAAASQQQRSQR